MLRVFAFIAACLACTQALAGRPPMLTPASPAALIERLPRGYAALEPRARAQPPLPAARQLLVAAAATGDARLGARAQALLDRLPPAQAGTAEALRLRAFSAQHRHDFRAAVAALDQLVALDPRDGDARLSRAQIRLVTGRLDLARADCAALVLGVDAAEGTLCAAALSLRLGKLEVAAMLSERWLGSVPVADARRGYALMLRAEAASRARAADADAWYRQALALDSNDVRTLRAFSRHLRASGRPALARKLLAAAPDSDGIALERALAARAAGSADADALAEAQGRRYALARELGSTPELRDEAEYYLTLRGEPGTALALARRNFASQRDVEDASILRRAAQAVGKPEAIAEVSAWERSQGIGAALNGARR